MRTGGIVSSLRVAGSFKVLSIFFICAALLLLTSSAVRASTQGEESDGSEVVSDKSLSAPTSSTTEEESDPSGYWTEERMRSAIPADRFDEDQVYPDASSELLAPEDQVGEDLSDPVAPTEPTTQTQANAPVPATAE